MLCSQQCRLGTVFYAKLNQYSADVIAFSTLGKLMQLSDFCICQSLCQQFEHIQFALAEISGYLGTLRGAGLADLVKFFTRHTWIDTRTAGSSPYNGFDQLGARGTLEQLAGGSAWNGIEYPLNFRIVG